MKPATETEQTPAVEYCEDHHAPICAKCGYCTEDPEHQKHTPAAEHSPLRQFQDALNRITWNDEPKSAAIANAALKVNDANDQVAVNEREELIAALRDSLSWQTCCGENQVCQNDQSHNRARNVLDRADKKRD